MLCQHAARLNNVTMVPPAPQGGRVQAVTPQPGVLKLLRMSVSGLQVRLGKAMWPVRLARYALWFFECLALGSCAGCAARTHDCGSAGGDLQPACELHWRRAATHDASAAVAQPRHVRRQR